MRKEQTLNVNSKVNIPEIIGNELIDVDMQPNIIKMTQSNSKIMCEGELLLTFLYSEAGQTQINSKNATIPFEMTLDNIENAENMNVTPSVEIQSNNCKVEGGAVNCNADLRFDVGLHENRSLDIIDEISETELQDPQDYSVVIYIVKKGDTLWQIAKRFRSTVDDIVRVNGLENPERIIEGEKLYIPKTVRAVASYV